MIHAAAAGCIVSVDCGALVWWAASSWLPRGASQRIGRGKKQAVARAGPELSRRRGSRAHWLVEGGPWSGAVRTCSLHTARVVRCRSLALRRSSLCVAGVAAA